MSDEAKYDKILTSLGELKGTTASISKDLEHIRTDVAINTKDLAAHIAGVQTNKQRLDTEIVIRDRLLTQQATENKSEFESLKGRLDIVEFVPNLLRNLGKALKWLGAIALPLLIITKLTNLW